MMQSPVDTLHTFQSLLALFQQREAVAQAASVPGSRSIVEIINAFSTVAAAMAAVVAAWIAYREMLRGNREQTLRGDLERQEQHRSDQQIGVLAFALGEQCMGWMSRGYLDGVKQWISLVRRGIALAESRITQLQLEAIRASPKVGAIANQAFVEYHQVIECFDYLCMDIEDGSEYKQNRTETLARILALQSSLLHLVPSELRKYQAMLETISPLTSVPAPEEPGNSR